MALPRNLSSKRIISEKSLERKEETEHAVNTSVRKNGNNYLNMLHSRNIYLTHTVCYKVLVIQKEEDLFFSF